MKIVIKYSIGALFIFLGLPFLDNDFYSINAGIFFILAGLLVIPPFWNWFKANLPHQLRASDQMMAVSFNLFAGLCLLTLVLPDVAVTDEERAYTHTKEWKKQKSSKELVTSDVERVAGNTESLFRKSTPAN